MTSDTLRSPVKNDYTTSPAGAETVTFVGRPFPLDKVQQHLPQLWRWGLTFGASYRVLHATLS